MSDLAIDHRERTWSRAVRNHNEVAAHRRGECEGLCAVSIGRMVFVLERQIRGGWRFVAMGVRGEDGRMSVVREDRRRDQPKNAQKRRRRRALRRH